MEILSKIQTQEEIGSSIYHGGILDHGAGHLHPLKYSLGLMDAAEQLNVNIFENSQVKKINQARDYIEVLTPDGQVKAKKIAVCCNAYLKGLNYGI